MKKKKVSIRKLSKVVPKLDKDKQNYILGYAEGMADEKERQKNRQLQEVG